MKDNSDKKLKAGDLATARFFSVTPFMVSIVRPSSRGPYILCKPEESTVMQTTKDGYIAFLPGELSKLGGGRAYMKDFFGKVLNVGDYATTIPEHGIKISGGTAVRLVGHPWFKTCGKVKITTIDGTRTLTYRTRSLIKQELEDLI